MKLENESICFHSTLGHKPVSKAAELVNDAFEPERLKAQSEENHDEFSHDVNGNNDLDDDMQYTTEDEIFLNPSKEDFSSVHGMDNNHVRVFNVDSFEKDSEVYVEKNVPECDLPEFIVYYKENSCNIVKDICIDEGTMPSPSPDGVIFESDKGQNDQNDKWMKELQITDIAMANKFKNSEQSLSEKDLVDQNQIDNNELDPSIGVECDLEDLNTKQTVELEPCDGNCNGDNGVEEDIVQVFQVIPSDLSYNSKVENESITFNFSSLEPDSNGKSELPENGANREDRSKSEFGTLSKVEHGTASTIQLGVGESSFSCVGPLASMVNFSSPAAYSGSLSIRSDSSTTSTGSFAFPILQADWHHNSPARMAKANRRFVRKNSGWRQGLFCCRF